jgi:hypothetical protein
MTYTSNTELKNRRRTRIPKWAILDSAKNSIKTKEIKSQDGTKTIKLCQYCYEFQGMYIYEWKLRCIKCYRMIFPTFVPPSAKRYGYKDNNVIFNSSTYKD